MELMIGEPEDLPGPETPPPPTQTSVRIGVSGGELLAVMTIKGNVTPSVAESARIRLIELLQKGGHHSFFTYSRHAISSQFHV